MVGHKWIQLDATLGQKASIILPLGLKGDAFLLTLFLSIGTIVHNLKQMYLVTLVLCLTSVMFVIPYLSKDNKHMCVFSSNYNKLALLLSEVDLARSKHKTGCL